RGKELSPVEMPAMRCDTDERGTLGRRGIAVNALARGVRVPSTSAARSSLVRDESVNAEVRRSMDESASALNRGDVETILRSYAPDAVLLPPNSPGVQGILAIRQLWESFLASGFCNAALEFDQIEHWGDV